MSSTISVALITALSTLGGVVITGTITLLANRMQIREQLKLADKNLKDQHSKDARQIRRDVYVQFLNQVSLVEHQLHELWIGKTPPKTTPLVELVSAVDAEMSELGARLNLVFLEGPPSVAASADQLHATLNTETAKLQWVLMTSSENELPAVRGEEVYNDAFKTRQAARSQFIDAAQKALTGDYGIVIASK